MVVMAAYLGTVIGGVVGFFLGAVWTFLILSGQIANPQK